MADPGWCRRCNPPSDVFACQFENSYGLFEDPDPPPPFMNSWILHCFDKISRELSSRIYQGTDHSSPVWVSPPSSIGGGPLYPMLTPPIPYFSIGPMGMAFSWRGCSLQTISPVGRRSPLLRTRGYVILWGNRGGSVGSAFDSGPMCCRFESHLRN